MSQSHEKAETFGKINSAKCWQRRALRNALSLVTAWLFWIGPLENCLPLSPKSERLHTLWPNSIAHNVYSAEIFACLFTKTHIQVCSNSHYSIAKNWEQPKCPQKEAEDLRSVRIQRHRQAACYITSWMTLTNTVTETRPQICKLVPFTELKGKAHLLVTGWLTHTTSLPAQNETLFYPIVQEIYKCEAPDLILAASVETWLMRQFLVLSAVATKHWGIFCQDLAPP